MSGICGIVSYNDEPVDHALLMGMTALMTRRGPDGASWWHSGTIGLGHTRLITTRPAAHELQPFEDPDTGCVVVADARLDNRTDLLERLRLTDRAAELGDGALILAAYREWGQDCPARLLGDYAFAIWDPREQSLFCARDHFGVKPFYYHCLPGRRFVFASEPRAILAVPQTPDLLNEARIADFLVTQLEGIDQTSTFFAGVHRLPPAHSLRVKCNSASLRRYWLAEPGPQLNLKSSAAYADGFLEIFTEAIRCRLTGENVGCMLSGGLDSSSIVAVAQHLLSGAGDGPLRTFSAISSVRSDCVETAAIRSALTMEGLHAQVVDVGAIDTIRKTLVDLIWSAEEPFDNHMTLARAIYLLAAQSGVNAVLDGIDGDSVLAEGNYVHHLLRRGRWWQAYQEAAGRNRFWGLSAPSASHFVRAVAGAHTPQQIRRWRQQLSAERVSGKRLEQNIRQTFMAPEFARRANLRGRLALLDATRTYNQTSDIRRYRAQAISHAYITVGLERYNRVASFLSIEPRHPFLDKRLVEFCLGLPGDQLLRNGWPKAILREAMDGRLPDGVRWRKGKENLGWTFTSALLRMMAEDAPQTLADHEELLAPYIDVAAAKRAAEEIRGGDDAQREAVFNVLSLCAWLQRNAKRPLLIRGAGSAGSLNIASLA